MQELNREANTLSSKSIVVETTQGAVELKVLIEQMREQNSKYRVDETGNSFHSHSTVWRRKNLAC